MQLIGIPDYGPPPDRKPPIQEECKTIFFSVDFIVSLKSSQWYTVYMYIYIYIYMNMCKYVCVYKYIIYIEYTAVYFLYNTFFLWKIITTALTGAATQILLQLQEAFRRCMRRPKRFWKSFMAPACLRRASGCRWAALGCWRRQIWWHHGSEKWENWDFHWTY